MDNVLSALNYFIFQPVYTDDADGYIYNVLTRSESCPNLEMYHPKWSTHMQRKRAFSEHYVHPEENDTESNITPSRRSDTDLTRIDKRKTFEGPNPNMVHTGDMLARVVQALGTITTYDHDADAGAFRQGAVHGFSDSNILAEERSLSARSGSECQTPPSKPRLRAKSEYCAPDQSQLDEQQWTWNGTNSQIQELRKMRAKMNNNQNDLFRQVVSANTKLNGSQPHAINIDDASTPPLTDTPPMKKKSFFNKINPFKKHELGTDSRHNSIIDFEPPLEARKYLDATTRGRESKMSLRQQYANATSRGRPSIFAVNDNPDQDLLENTTIADLIRALEVAHIQENTPGSLLFSGHGMPSPQPTRMHRPSAGSRRPSMFPADFNEFKELSDTMPTHLNRPHTGASRRPSMFPADISEKDELSENISSRYMKSPSAGSRRPSMLPNDSGVHENSSSRLNKPLTGGRRASMFPADFNEFQKFTENILSDNLLGSSLPPQVQAAARRASMYPTEPGLAEFQANHVRRQSMMPSERTSTTHSPNDSPQLEQRRFSGRVLKPSLNVPQLGTSGPPNMQHHRRLSLRPSPLARELPSASSSPFLNNRNGLQPFSTSGTRHVLFRPLQLQVPGSIQDSEDEEDEKEQKTKRVGYK